MKIAIQGGPASFHHIAAENYFDQFDLDLICCDRFPQVCTALAENRADAAVMAIENTSAGSILPNCSLPIHHSLAIVGETYLRVEHNLMALPGQVLDDIATVRSHPMALLQCAGFLRDHPKLRSLESFDTAESAREIRETLMLGVAAIASTKASNLYDLEILAPGIETEKRNFTRFLILSRESAAAPTAADKATLSFLTRHTPGALVAVLDIFSRMNLNLTLIQSVPLPGRPYEYSFYVDVEWSDREIFERALYELRAATLELHIVGIYQKGLRPTEGVTQASLTDTNNPAAK